MMMMIIYNDDVGADDDNDGEENKNIPFKMQVQYILLIPKENI